MIVNKKVSLTLADLGKGVEPITILRAFSLAADKAQWTHEETNLVLKEALAQDYDHLVTVIGDHCE